MMLPDGGDGGRADVRALAWCHRLCVDGLRVTCGNAAYSVTESWVIVELAGRDTTEVRDLRRRLDIDPGYLSRVLARLQAERLVARHRSAADGRRRTVRLTAEGRTVAEAVDARMAQTVRKRLSVLPAPDRQRIIDALAAIRQAMDSAGGGRRAG